MTPNTLRRRPLLLGGLAAACGAGRAAPAPATVAAASDLKFALDAIAAPFEAVSGHRLRLVYGSSGQFYAQILQGAPFHLFLSADEDFVLRLADAGRTVDRGRRYASGRIALLVARDSPLQPDGSLGDLAAALGDGRLRKFAIAHPEHAPYGRRAEEALRHAGLWQRIRPHLVLGENVSQAAQFAASGAAQGGIVALSLALAPPLAQHTRHGLIDAAWHRPLLQRMAVMRGAPAAAIAFYEHLSSAAAQATLARYGFVAPRD